MSQTRFNIPLEQAKIPEVSAVFETPSATSDRSAILLAHGAGFSMDSPWMAQVADGLCRRGFAVLRFNYPYRERALREERQRPPDKAEILERAHAKALRALEERVGDRRILLAGKSLGGRMATHLAAKGENAAGLVLLGYPLHPPEKPERIRSEHFPTLAQPALFLQGTRDKLCRLDLLEQALRSYGGTATVEIIDDADHGFHVRKSSGRSDAEVLENMLERIAAWELSTFG
jgi:predicted alpha/beta-hydrolase family hydrolase